MKPALIDTDILSLFFRNHSKVVNYFEKYLKKYEKINICIITYYEILSGLKYKDSKKLMQKFLEFIKYNNVILLTINAVNISSDIYKELKRKGKLIEDIDILIAGINSFIK